MRRLNVRERYDLEDGIRRATALMTYQSEWSWFVKRHSCNVIQRAVDHSSSAKQLSYQTGIASGSISNLRKGITILKPEQYFKIVGAVYPEYGKIIEAELHDIERLND